MDLILLTTNNKQQGGLYIFSACKKAPSVRKGGAF